MSQDLATQFEADYKAEEAARNARMDAALANIARLEPQVQNINLQHPQQQPQPSNVGQHLGEVVPAVFSGMGKAVSNTAEALDELWDMGGQHWEDLHALMPDVPFSQDSSMQIPTADLETGTGRVTESVAQFLTAFIPASRAVKAVGTSAKFLSGLQNPIARGMTAGAVADYAAFDPTEARVATAIQGLVPEVQMPIVSWLASTDPNDTIEGRLKNVIEGAGLGVVGEMLIKSAKGIKGSIGKKPEGVEEVVQSNKTMDEALEDMRKAREAEMSAREKYDHGQFFARPDATIVEDVADRIVRGDTFEGLRPMFNWDYIDSPDRVKSIINSLNDHLPGMLASKGFKMHKGWDEAVGQAKTYFDDNGLKLADKLKTTVDGVKDLDTAVVLAKEMHVASSHRMAELAETIASGSATRHDLLRFKRQMGFHAEIQATVKGISSSIGRALNAHKMFRDGTMIDDDFLELALNSAGGDEVLRKVAKKYLTLNDPKRRNLFVEKSFGEKTVEGIQFWWINALLSGPTTQVINMIGNAGVALMGVAETAYAAGKNTITGKGEIQLGDAVAQVTGMWQGLIDSVRISAEGMKAIGAITTRGKVANKANILTNPEHVGSVYQAFARRISTIDPANTHKLDYEIEMGAFGSGKLGGMTKLLEGVISTPTRMLMAGDELFKTIHYRGYLNMLASIEARKQGIDITQRGQFIEQFMRPENIKASVVKEALEFAKKGTFQNDLGKTGKHLQGMVQTTPMLRFIMPFIRTPVNIIKYAVHHSPLMVHPTLRKISTQMSDDIAAGGVKKELAEAKIATGTMLFGVASLLAYNGILTNGTDEDMRYGGTGELVGKQRYSVRLGDKHYSFERTDPFGIFFGATADLVALAQHVDEREWSETAGAALAILSNNLTNKTYLQGVIDFTDAMMNSEGTTSKKAERFMSNFVSSFVPNAMNQANRIMSDQEMKEMNTFMDYIMKRTPMSEQVFPKRDRIDGKPVHYKDGLLGGLVPIQVSSKNDDPLRNELHRIGYMPSKMNKGFSYNQVKIELGGQEYDQFQTTATQKVRISGKTQEEFLNWLIKTPYYQSLPDNLDDANMPTKSRLISNTMGRYRNAAKNQLFRESPTIQKKYQEGLQEARNQQLLSR